MNVKGNVVVGPFKWVQRWLWSCGVVKVIQRHDVSASLGPTRRVGVYQRMVWANMRGHSEWRAQAAGNTWEKWGWGGGGSETKSPSWAWRHLRGLHGELWLVHIVINDLSGVDLAWLISVATSVIKQRAKCRVGGLIFVIWSFLLIFRCMRTFTVRHGCLVYLTAVVGYW